MLLLPPATLRHEHDNRHSPWRKHQQKILRSRELDSPRMNHPPDDDRRTQNPKRRKLRHIASRKEPRNVPQDSLNESIKLRVEH
jgi:hypothetical protein